MTITDVIGLAKDLIVILTAATGAVVAVVGLTTWQRQLKGQAEYDLARRLLVSLYKYRDAVNGVRNPAIWAYEMPSPPAEEAVSMSQEKKRFYGISKAYQARWDKVENSRSQLYTDLIEGDYPLDTSTMSFYMLAIERKDRWPASSQSASSSPASLTMRPA